MFVFLKKEPPGVIHIFIYPSLALENSSPNLKSNEAL